MKTAMLGQALRSGRPNHIQSEIQRLKDELEKKELEITELTKQLNNEEEVISEIIPVTQPTESAKRNVKLVRKIAKSTETEADIASVTIKTQRSRVLLSNRSTAKLTNKVTSQFKGSLTTRNTTKP